MVPSFNKSLNDSLVYFLSYGVTLAGFLQFIFLYFFVRKYFRFNKDEHIIRLHIGLEDPKDLINHLKNSLKYIK